MTSTARITWSPWRHLDEWYPNIRVLETDALPDRMLGGVEHERGIIWLARGMTEPQRRSTLAWELGHLELGPFDRDRSDDGMVADWASRLLIAFGDLLLTCQRHAELPDVAEALWVDVHMLKARLRGLGDEEWNLLDATCWHWRDAL